ncbi:very short patch repair endonuclease [Burkholderia vietnamiensis]|uniref:very short patch repair endonuclease n=1 Tax=Burkholderia vietnamiensis TaxID=60552 RepID=UPI00265598B9|nr:very short patch repair endonuclease [Burkholderia vietnamiensis]MDN7820904.1 very short patch repair endonuclease [Burkholderia vietnamiensis]
MVDVLSAEQRRLNMSRIRGRDTKPEMLIRRGLHARGLRYRLHVRTLPGRPDLVFAKHHTVAFVHGCFWHAHRCALSKLPATHQDFWRKKLDGNSARDRKAIESLHADGWRVLVVWECALRGPRRMLVEDLLDFVVCFVKSGEPRYFELAGLPEGCR